MLFSYLLTCPKLLQTGVKGHNILNNMIEFGVKKRVMAIGGRAGQTLYYAAPKVRPRLTLRQLEDDIVRATSLARGDVRNALASFAEIVNSALERGSAVDLGDLGALKVEVGSRMVDRPEDVNASILKTPVVRFTPKREMVAAAKSVKVKVVNPYTGAETEG